MYKNASDINALYNWIAAVFADAAVWAIPEIYIFRAFRDR